MLEIDRLNLQVIDELGDELNPETYSDDQSHEGMPQEMLIKGSPRNFLRKGAGLQLQRERALKNISPNPEPQPYFLPFKRSASPNPLRKAAKTTKASL